jgi:hypothetical protein
MNGIVSMPDDRLRVLAASNLYPSPNWMIAHLRVQRPTKVQPVTWAGASQSGEQRPLQGALAAGDRDCRKCAEAKNGFGGHQGRKQLRIRTAGHPHTLVRERHWRGELTSGVR